MNVEESKLLRNCFTGIYSLDKGTVGDENIKMAIIEPHNYVLKPQREGGGNNYYGDNVKIKLSSMNRDEASAYILMDRIVAPPYRNVLLRDGNVIEADVVSELGIYGIWIR
jgi:glutathione synthase